MGRDIDVLCKPGSMWTVPGLGSEALVHTGWPRLSCPAPFPISCLQHAYLGDLSPKSHRAAVAESVPRES